MVMIQKKKVKRESTPPASLLTTCFPSPSLPTIVVDSGLRISVPLSLPRHLQTSIVQARGGHYHCSHNPSSSSLTSFLSVVFALHLRVARSFQKTNGSHSVANTDTIQLLGSRLTSFSAVRPNGGI